jgi:hypothetical protein
MTWARNDQKLFTRRLNVNDFELGILVVTTHTYEATHPMWLTVLRSSAELINSKQLDQSSYENSMCWPARHITFESIKDASRITER